MNGASRREKEKKRSAPLPLHLYLYQPPPPLPNFPNPPLPQKPYPLPSLSLLLPTQHLNPYLLLRKLPNRQSCGAESAGSRREREAEDRVGREGIRVDFSVFRRGGGGGRRGERGEKSCFRGEGRRGGRDCAGDEREEGLSGGEAREGVPGVGFVADAVRESGERSDPEEDEEKGREGGKMGRKGTYRRGISSVLKLCKPAIWPSRVRKPTVIVGTPRRKLWR